MVKDLKLPVNDNDPVILSWTKPDLTSDNSEFFQGYNVTSSRSVSQTTLSRSKRNIPPSESQTVTLGPDETSYNYSRRCPYNDSLTLCPYSEYCFSVVSLFAFGSIPIDASDPTITTRCSRTGEAGESMIFELFTTLMLCCVVSS